MSATPPERAGAGAALAQVSNELGIAVGLTILGSLGTVVYRILLDLPHSPASVSVVDGIRDASARGDLQLLQHVRAAFTDAFNVVGLVGVGVLGLVLLLARPRPSRALPVTGMNG
ncbi:hypothetical protein [Nonomuraea sp. JJY05]|uniref:hypothetical protein n=1 Tax=Nonomuraea sp. JJY05 TaxID=3350255 RepID=UPI00373E52EF